MDQGYFVCGRLSSWSSLWCAPEFFSQARDVVGNQCRCAVLNQHIENFVVLSPLCVCQRQVVDYKSAKTERRTVVFFKRLEGVVRIFRVVVNVIIHNNKTGVGGPQQIASFKEKLHEFRTVGCTFHALSHSRQISILPLHMISISLFPHSFLVKYPHSKRWILFLSS